MRTNDDRSRGGLSDASYEDAFETPRESPVKGLASQDSPEVPFEEDLFHGSQGLTAKLRIINDQIPQNAINLQFWAGINLIMHIIS